MIVALHQLAVEPWTFTCRECGARWDPLPARGKPHPTEASLQREADQHLKNCPARLDGLEEFL